MAKVHISSKQTTGLFLTDNQSDGVEAEIPSFRLVWIEEVTQEYLEVQKYLRSHIPLEAQ